jgi:putative methionine-R-sulfoxide reductase with GAF domain
MDHYSILDHSPPQAPRETILPESKSKRFPSPREVSPERLRFPGDDGGKSLNHMAQRDLDAALQLLAERAQYITGASGAAIALRQGDKMICRARSGESAPELGAHLQVDSGLSAEAVRTRKILRCDDADTDPRVNRESCRSLGIASVAVMPLVREQEVNGIFELLSGRARAFEERDVAALERLAEMIQTALDHADAAKRAENEMTVSANTVAAGPGKVESKDKVESNPLMRPALEKESDITPTTEGLANPQAPSAIMDSSLAEVPEDGADSLVTLLSERGNIGTCQACGFPVSEGRKLCLDCEADQIPETASIASPAIPASDGAPEFLANLAAPEVKSWWQSHSYVVVTILLVAATVILILWRNL